MSHPKRQVVSLREQADTHSRDPVVDEILGWLTAGLSFGVPIDMRNDGTVGGQTVRHMKGSWVSLTLTATTGSVTCTHNLDIPTTSVTGAGGTANLPNVRWLLFGLEYGDRTGTNAAPAAPGAFTVNFLKMVNATVTRDAIDLRYAVSGFVPSATAPLSVTLYFVPAVR